MKTTLCLSLLSTKRNNVLCIVGLFLILVSCANQQTQILDEVRQLKALYPDSALLVLEAIDADILAPQAEAEWCLLNGALRDTLKKKMEIDTLRLQRAVAFYEAKHLPVCQAKVGLYLGRAYLQNHSHRSAATAYLSALEAVGETEEDNLAGYISSYLADLYKSERNYEEALTLYTQASHKFLQADNVRSYGIALRDMGGIHSLIPHFDKAFSLYQVADSIACALNDSVVMSTIANYRGITYMSMEKYLLAERDLLKAIEIDPKDDNIGSYFGLSEVYLKMGDLVKANKCLDYIDKKEKDIYTQESLWLQKCKLYELQNRETEALESMWEFVQCRDSVFKLESRIQAANVAKKYHYLETQKENDKLETQLYKRLIWIFILSIVSLCVYLVLTQMLHQQKRELDRKRHEVEQQEYIEREQKLKLKESEIELTEQRLIVQKKEIELQEQKEKSKQLKEKEIIAKRGLLKRSLVFKKVRMLSGLRTSNPIAFQQEVEKILKASSLSEEDWEEIKNEINHVYLDFTDKLFAKLPRLTEDEIRFCCLLKMELDTNELAILLNINPASVDRRRARINKKIKEVSPDASWRDFLNEL